jgi:signal peptidase II
MTKNDGKTILLITIPLLILIFDRVTKYIVNLIILPGQNISILGQLLTFTKTFNKGFAFGMGQQFGIINAAVATLIVFALIYFFTKSDFQLKLPLSVIIGGAISNIIDRIFFFPNGVLDFIRVFGFSTFNIADIAITLGGIWILIVLIKSEKEINKKHK